MRPVAFTALLLGLLSCVWGCKANEASTPPAFARLPYADEATSPTTKVFLVAGGDDVANFAAEVLEQRELWRRAGVSDDEIACYYAKPTAAAWKVDKRQYRRLKRALSDCHAATPARLRADLLRSASHPLPFVYLYVSSHGIDTQTRLIPKGWQAVGGDLVPAERAWLEQAAIGLEAGELGLGQITNFVAAARAGQDPATLMLTPASLTDALGRFEPSTVKITVLQACYSGAFIGHRLGQAAASDDQPKDLRKVENLVAITASAAERPSFGCGSGSEHTYFGGAYNRALARALQAGVNPTELDWHAVFERTRTAIEAMERAQDQQPSRPGFLSTQPTAASERTLDP